MMKHGLLAPQYGVSRTTLSEFDAPARHLAPVFEASPTVSPSSPKVTFKRRRLVGPTPVASVPEAVASAPAAPRVYRLESPPAANEQRTPGQHQQATAPEVSPPAAQQLRRRRDTATRSPRLVSHVVFGQPPAKTSSPGQLLSDEPAKLDTKALRAALARLDATLESVARAQEAFRALDKLLTSLGVGGEASPPRRVRRTADALVSPMKRGVTAREPPAE